MIGAAQVKEVSVVVWEDFNVAHCQCMIIKKRQESRVSKHMLTWVWWSWNFHPFWRHHQSTHPRSTIRLTPNTPQSNNRRSLCLFSLNLTLQQRFALLSFSIFLPHPNREPFLAPEKLASRFLCLPQTKAIYITLFWFIGKGIHNLEFPFLRSVFGGWCPCYI